MAHQAVDFYRNTVPTLSGPKSTPRLSLQEHSRVVCRGRIHGEDPQISVNRSTAVVSVQSVKSKQKRLRNSACDGKRHSETALVTEIELSTRVQRGAMVKGLRREKGSFNSTGRFFLNHNLNACSWRLQRTLKERIANLKGRLS